MDQAPQVTPGPSSSTSSAAGTPQQLIEQLTQLIGVLQKAHGVLPGFDELLARQRAQEQHAQQQRGAQKLQQEQIEKWVAQELLVTQLTQQLGVYAQALEQLQSICQQQELRVSAIQAHAADLQQQLGQKHKRIEGLEGDSAAKDKLIQDLEGLERQDDPRHGSPSTNTAARLSVTTTDTVTQGSSGTMSGSDMIPELGLHRQPLRGGPHSSSGVEESMDTAQRQQSDSGMQELKGTPWLKRMPCLIIGRHPQAPRDVPIVCKQITGSLLLGNVREELRIRPNLAGNQLLSPSEFEAAAGCSKGKNWKANIRVVGKNGSTQMLKVWLPGMLQLVGDHAKVAIADVDIKTLLDAESGLRIQSEA